MATSFPTALCLFLLAYSGRNFINLGFIERPIILGLLWALIFDQPVPALPLAVFFELFWLDRFPIGSYLPPFPAFSFMLLLALTDAYGWSSPQVVCFPLALSLPLAYVIPHIESYARKKQNASYDLLLATVGRDDFETVLSSVLRRAFFQQIIMAGALFTAVYTMLHLFFVLNGDVVLSNTTTWLGIIAVGCLGAVMALRITVAYKAFILALATVAVFKFL